MLQKTDRRVYNIAGHVGMVLGGKIPDSRNLMINARAQATGYLNNFDINISGKVLADRIAGYAHLHTLYQFRRPFGSSVIFAVHDMKGFNLHMVTPSGECFVSPDLFSSDFPGLLLLHSGKREINSEN